MNMDEQDGAEKHALVIEDDALLNKLFGKWFERLGYSVHHAFTGKEGLSALEQRTYTVVMLDQHLPDTTGAELYPKLRELTPNALVVLCSAFEPEGHLREVVRRGEASFVRKPCFYADLVAALGTLEADKMPS